MKSTIARALVCFLAVVFGFGAGTALADRKDELKDEFRKRLSEIDALKGAGKIGETHEGYVGAVKGNLSNKEEKLVDAENADRKELYQIIAKDENTTVDFVAQKNAQRNAKNLKKGEYFKLKNGTWKQKE